MKSFMEWLFESNGHSRGEVSSLLEDAVGLGAVVGELNKAGIGHRVVKVGDSSVVVLPDSNLVVYDFDNGYGLVDLVGDFLYSDYGEGMRESIDFSKEFWNNPQVLYHATSGDILPRLKPGDSHSNLNERFLVR
jgi:hypothetical protein